MDKEIKNQIEEYKIIAIVRRLYGEDLIGLAQALFDGGIRVLEITFDQADPDCIPKTYNAISLLNRKMNGKMGLGAGTVLNVAQVDAALAGGARFIVSPNTNEDVIRHSKEKGLISIPGSMTPTEMISAHNFGADFVKVFPVSDLGLNYMKSIMSPINHIKFIATGGVCLENFQDILNIGFVGAGIGGFLTDKKLIANRNFAELTDRASKFVEITKKVL